MSDELKPCPFCGGKPTFVHATSEDIGNGYVCRTLAVISCDHCMFDMTGETDEDAVVTWNARAERECEWVRGQRKSDGERQWLTGCGEEYILEEPPRCCPNCGGTVEEVG